MAALWRGTVFSSFVRNSARVFLCGKNPAAVKPRVWMSLLRKGVASAAVGGAALCAIPFRQTETLSHDSLIKRAASLVTDSSSTFLSQTTLALIDAITDYSKAVHTLIALQKRYLTSMGNMTPAEEDTIWQVIIGQRAEVNDRQDEYKRFESTWVTAVKLCETAAEAAYTSGAEHASITARTNIMLAQTQVDEALKLSLDAEKKLAETKVMEIERIAQSGTDEEEIPDAYLRED